MYDLNGQNGMNGFPTVEMDKLFSLDALKQCIVNPEGKRVVINGTEQEEKPAETQQPEKSSAWDSIKAFLIIAVFIGGMISAAVFSKSEPLLCIASVGAIFFVIGTIVVFQNGFSADNIIGLIFPLAGGLMVALPVLVLEHRKDAAKGISTGTALNIMLGGLAVVGLLVILSTVFTNKGKEKRCTASINARCIYTDIHYSTTHDARGRTRHIKLFCPTWQYEVGGVIYVTRENVHSNLDTPRVGECRDIFYDPSDPSDIYRPVKKNDMVAYIVGIAFIAAGIVSVYMRTR